MGGQGVPIAAKDAREISSDCEARWFAFNLTLESKLVLEKKSCPEHLQDLDCLDSATSVLQILMELEDAGEAT